MGCTTSVETKQASSLDNAFKTNIESATSDSLNLARKLGMSKKQQQPMAVDDKHSMIVHQDELIMDTTQIHKSNDSGIGKEFLDTLCNKVSAKQKG
uniref:Uncharacterized protein n=1 Tax=Romanomermis culicivorax TaxID=13658 RepID=A0A915HM60_ROMCU